MTKDTWLRILHTARHYRRTQRTTIRNAVYSAALLWGEL
jgi:hypothetical protein